MRARQYIESVRPDDEQRPARASTVRGSRTKLRITAHPRISPISAGLQAILLCRQTHGDATGLSNMRPASFAPRMQVASN